MHFSDYRLSKKLRDPGIVNNEEIKNQVFLNDSIDKITDEDYIGYAEGYTERRSSQDASDFLHETFHIETGSDFARLPLDKANRLNSELLRVRDAWGTIGFIDRVVIDSSKIPDDSNGAFAPVERAFLLRSVFLDETSEPYLSDKECYKSIGFYYHSTESPWHVYWHETGHAVYHYVVGAVDSDAASRAEEVFHRYFPRRFDRNSEGIRRISICACINEGEMFAEAFAMTMISNERSPFAKEILNYIIFGQV